MVPVVRFGKLLAMGFGWEFWVLTLLLKKVCKIAGSMLANRELSLIRLGSPARR